MSVRRKCAPQMSTQIRQISTGWYHARKDVNAFTPDKRRGPEPKQPNASLTEQAGLPEWTGSTWSDSRQQRPGRPSGMGSAVWTGEVIR